MIYNWHQKWYPEWCLQGRKPAPHRAGPLPEIRCQPQHSSKSNADVSRRRLIEKCPGKGTIVLSSVPVAPESPKVITNKNIGFFLPKENIITEPFYSSLFNILERDFQKNGCSLIYTTLDASDNIADKITALGLSGIVFVSNVVQKHIEYAVSQKIPCVLVNSYSDKLPSVLSDNRKGAYLAGRYLIEHGHKTVALLAGVRSYLSNQERTAGFLQAFQEEGLSIPPELILETGSWLYDAAEKGVLWTFSTLTQAKCLLPCLHLMTVWQLEHQCHLQNRSYCTWRCKCDRLW